MTPISIVTMLLGCTLFKLMENRNLKGLPEKSALYIMSQLFSTIKYCHDNQVVHLDLKLENVMINESTGFIKLIDFGLCDFINGRGDLFTRIHGSEDYLPAEMIKHPEQPYSGTKADVWCLGIILYGLMSGSFPFNPIGRRKSINLGEPHPTPKFYFKCSKKLKDLLNKMLEPTPTLRISIDEILKHPWMKQKSKWSL